MKLCDRYLSFLTSSGLHSADLAPPPGIMSATIVASGNWLTYGEIQPPELSVHETDDSIAKVQEVF